MGRAMQVGHNSMRTPCMPLHREQSSQMGQGRSVNTFKFSIFQRMAAWATGNRSLLAESFFSREIAVSQMHSKAQQKVTSGTVISGFH